jgi:hypothetical protein
MEACIKGRKCGGSSGVLHGPVMLTKVMLRSCWWWWGAHAKNEVPLEKGALFCRLITISYTMWHAGQDHREACVQHHRNCTCSQLRAASEASPEPGSHGPVLVHPGVDSDPCIFKALHATTVLS